MVYVCYLAGRLWGFFFMLVVVFNIIYASLNRNGKGVEKGEVKKGGWDTS